MKLDPAKLDALFALRRNHRNAFLGADAPEMPVVIPVEEFIDLEVEAQKQQKWLDAIEPDNLCWSRRPPTSLRLYGIEVIPDRPTSEVLVKLRWVPDGLAKLRWVP